MLKGGSGYSPLVVLPRVVPPSLGFVEGVPWLKHPYEVGNTWTHHGHRIIDLEIADTGVGKANSSFTRCGVCYSSTVAASMSQHRLTQSTQTWQHRHRRQRLSLVGFTPRDGYKVADAFGLPTPRHLPMLFLL